MPARFSPQTKPPYSQPTVEQDNRASGNRLHAVRTFADPPRLSKVTVIVEWVCAGRLCRDERSVEIKQNTDFEMARTRQAVHRNVDEMLKRRCRICRM